MKKVYIGVAVLLLYAGVIGMLLPMLLSAASNEAFLLGIGLILIGILVPAHIAYNKFKKSQSQQKETE